MPGTDLSTITTISKLIEYLNREYDVQLPTELSADHPLSKLWEANIVVKGDSLPEDAVVKMRWDYIHPAVAESEILVWARGDPAPFSGISNDLTAGMVFIATRHTSAT